MSYQPFNIDHHGGIDLFLKLVKWGYFNGENYNETIPCGLHIACINQDNNVLEFQATLSCICNEIPRKLSHLNACFIFKFPKQWVVNLQHWNKNTANHTAGKFSESKNVNLTLQHLQDVNIIFLTEIFFYFFLYFFHVRMSCDMTVTLKHVNLTVRFIIYDLRQSFNRHMILQRLFKRPLNDEHFTMLLKFNIRKSCKLP